MATVHPEPDVATTPQGEGPGDAQLPHGGEGPQPEVPAPVFRGQSPIETITLPAEAEKHATVAKKPKVTKHASFDAPEEVLEAHTHTHTTHRKTAVNVHCASTFGHPHALSADSRSNSKGLDMIRQISKRSSVSTGSHKSRETVFEGLSPEAYEKILANKNQSSRVGAKNHHLRHTTHVVNEMLEQVEHDQQRLKVNIWLDEGDHDKIEEGAEVDEDDNERKPSFSEVTPIKHISWIRDGPIAVLAAMISILALIIVCAWDVREPRHDIHHLKMNKYQAHLTSPLYAVSADGPLTIHLDPDLPTEVLDIKMVIPCIGYCRGAVPHRRLTGEDEDHGETEVLPGGVVNWALFAGDRGLTEGAVVMVEGYEAEAYEIVDPSSLGFAPGEALTVRLTTNSQVPLGVMCQVNQLGILGRHRVVLSAILFVFAFGLILSEQINRCYATFLAVCGSLFLVCCTYGAPAVGTVMGMIDFGTLILLCTMMMCVHTFAVTGFFQWVAVRIACFADGDAKTLFFLMANAMGWMSCILPNVTCVMLIGPITISLCKQMNLDPVPFYLAQTICSTIGGTTTMIGDPPNLVIGNKLQLKFMDFIKFNGPVIFVMLPFASFLLYLRFKDKVVGKAKIDIEKMKRECPIIDERQFLYTSVVFAFITIGLFTSPVHGIRPAWFCLTGFFLMAMVNSHHHIKPYLNAVEWDTLLFFANLFIFVECLAELGLIKAIGDMLADTIRSVDLEWRLEVAVILVLWVSTIGSAFLESLPYTTTMTYILADLRNTGDMGIPVEPLCWALSVGACVGGIGSIMGSSANLVALAVSERYCPENPIKGSDFIRYGFPTLLIITVVAMLYQLLVFCVIRPYE